jgi:hypothetical protein
LFGFAALQGIVRKEVIIGRMMQNARLCSNWSLCSFSSDISSLRDVGDVKASEGYAKELKQEQLERQKQEISQEINETFRLVKAT